MTIRIVFLLQFLTSVTYSQIKKNNLYESVDKKMLLIPDSLTKSSISISGYILDNFKSNNDKCRAIFFWISTNIQYDVENMYNINFYEKREEKIDKTLRNKKGICSDYAYLFDDLCKKVNIESDIIAGYTMQKGMVEYIPHAWNIAYVDSTWFLFDATWAAGYVNNGKFYKKFNNEYYKPNPNSFIKTHMPFDYLWQLLLYPITNQEFYSLKFEENKSKSKFVYQDSIKLYDGQTRINQIKSEAYRVEKNGVKNSLIFDRLQYLKKEIEIYNQTQKVDLYNDAVNNYNVAIEQYNNYIKFKNNQFTPQKQDFEIQKIVDEPLKKLLLAETGLKQIGDDEQNKSFQKSQLVNMIVSLKNQLDQEQFWLNDYFSKNKTKRKSMFYKKTWFGIPIK